MVKAVKEESKAKKIINLVIMIIEILIIIGGIVFSATVIFGSKTKTDELAVGYNLTTVLTDSMEGSLTNEFEISSFRAKKDLLIIKSLSEDEFGELKVGDVITYTGRVGGEIQLISHRITKIEQTDIDGQSITYYYTLGDKYRTGNESEDIISSQKIYPGNIRGKVIKKISSVGAPIYWFQEDSKHFLFAVVIPLAVLLAYNIYLFIRMIVDYRIKKAREEGQLAVEAIKAQSTIDEEEIKRKAIEEYLAQQQKVEDAPKDKEVNGATIDEVAKEEN